MGLREQIASGMPGLVGDNVTVTAGAGDALAMVADLVCHPDSHVIIEIPAHESALVTAQRRGSAVSLLKAPVTPEAIIEHVSSSTTAVFLSSPHNPTGQVLTSGMLIEIATQLASVGGPGGTARCCRFGAQRCLDRQPLQGSWTSGTSLGLGGGAHDGC